MLAVLLDGILSNAAHDGTTDRSEESVVGLVAGETTGGTTGESTGKTTLAILSLTGGTLLLLLVVVTGNRLVKLFCRVNGGERGN